MDEKTGHHRGGFEMEELIIKIDAEVLGTVVALEPILNLLKEDLK